ESLRPTSLSRMPQTRLTGFYEELTLTPFLPRHTLSYIDTCAHRPTDRHATEQRSMRDRKRISLSRGPSCAEKVGVVLRSQPSVQICLGAQRDFLIRMTNTNAFLNSHRPGSLPASYL
ncbi:hypothetical protein KUCAC02_002238, partial [Chaenocephalus aceratus]